MTRQNMNPNADIGLLGEINMDKAIVADFLPSIDYANASIARKQARGEKN